jgi:hypothetical protein
MNDWMLLILQWGSPITLIVLLVLQIYTYRRTKHYSLALLAVAGAAALLSSSLVRLLSSEAFYPHLRADIFDVMIVSYVAYIVLGLWGAAALCRSYIRLTAANKVLSQPKSDTGASK